MDANEIPPTTKPRINEAKAIFKFKPDISLSGIFFKPNPLKKGPFGGLPPMIKFRHQVVVHQGVQCVPRISTLMRCAGSSMTLWPPQRWSSGGHEESGMPKSFGDGPHLESPTLSLPKIWVISPLLLISHLQKCKCQWYKKINLPGVGKGYERCFFQ